MGSDDTFKWRGGRQIKEELNTATRITRARRASTSSVAQEQRSDSPICSMGMGLRSRTCSCFRDCLGLLDRIRTFTIHIFLTRDPTGQRRKAVFCSIGEYADPVQIILVGHY